MDIKTKYNIGDTVWYHDEYIRSMVIQSVTATVREEPSSNYSTRLVKHEAYYSYSGTSKTLAELFDSKDAVAAYLLEKAK